MKLNVAVIFGGQSVEHEISVISAQQCIKALDSERYQVIPIYISKKGVWYTGEKLLNVDNFKDLDRLLNQCQKICLSPHAGEGKIYKDSLSWLGPRLLNVIDIAFPVMHGTNGEDGTLQGLLELMKIPYVGSGVLPIALVKDKIATKMFFKSFDIPMLDFIWFYQHEWITNKNHVLSQIASKFNYPLIVKPGNLGSTIGVTSVNHQKQLEDAIDLALSMSPRVLIEPKIKNLKEVNCSVLGDSESCEVSICEEPISTEGILSYKDKYLSGSKTKGGLTGKSEGLNQQGMSSTKRKIPADISKEKTKEIQALAKKIFIAGDLSGVVRIDFLIDEDTDQVYLCEVNPIPGSLAFYLWEPIGKNFTDLTTQLIEIALKKHRETLQLNTSYGYNILSTYSGTGKK